jgi:hypothetical protein
MNYTTYNANNFYIKKDSTFPILKYPLIQKLREEYDITDEMLENCAITFSLLDSESGCYKIANAAGNLVVNEDPAKFPDEEKYTLTYQFKLAQTSHAGRFLGEFVIDFLDEQYSCYKIKLPTTSYINVIISESLTKTTVV